MAIVTRRYVFRGTSLAAIQLDLGPTVSMAPGTWYLTKDVTYDNAISDQATVDAYMSGKGFTVDAKNTIALSANPFLGILSPDGSVWKLQADNLGVLTTLKVG